MRVCFIALEYFGWGKYGGIGRATRDIASGLVESGVEVSVVVPRGVDQRRVEFIDGVEVHGFPLMAYPLIGKLLRDVDADVYHSQDHTLGTWLAKRYCPESVHLLTCQNPKSSEDWEKVNQFYSPRRLLYNRFIEPQVKRCVRELDHVYCHAKYTIEKARKLFDLDYEPDFLPNPVMVPDSLPKKSDEPTVLFLGRFDGEKNPEEFLKLAEKFPDVGFIATGKSHDPDYDRMLRRKYSGVENLSMPGFLDGVAKDRVLSESWVLVNTSVSECFPVSFLEAAAHGCSILSPHDPDDFVSRFGVHVSNDGLVEGLDWLLKDERWRERGSKGYWYVREHHEKRKVIEQHLKEYEMWMG
jgi:glycosyltransferase involved in cell wall biosynthesis